MKHCYSIFLLAATSVCAAEPPRSRPAETVPPSADVEVATRRGLALLERAGSNWQKNKSCFSCHHQTLPMLTMIEAARAGLPLDAEWLKSQADFTHEYFGAHIDRMNAGEHIDGGAITVGYGLWALRLARRPADETTEAMITYLLKVQGLVRLKDVPPLQPPEKRSGQWMTSCRRAPMQVSEIAATVLVLTGMQHYATEQQQPQVAGARDSADKWLARSPLKSQEDRIWRLWGLHQLMGPVEQKESVRTVILGAQRDDGGWPQTDDRQSDAFSTGQTLFVLLSTGSSSNDRAVLRARDYLLRTQHADGSWLVETHAQPVQKFFENGDPHGKHQFISTAATAWGVAALARLLPPKAP